MTTHEHYLKYKNTIHKQNLKYYQLHKDEIKEKSRKWKIENKERVKDYQYDWWRKKSPEERKEYRKQQYEKNKERENEKHREWLKKNPYHSRLGNLDLQLAMINVRIRDNNKCRWYGCNIKYGDKPIHVHHIFPRSEYPELELIEQYMICYCVDHHRQWHKARGDSAANILFDNRRYK